MISSHANTPRALLTLPKKLKKQKVITSSYMCLRQVSCWIIHGCQNVYTKYLRLNAKF